MKPFLKSHFKEFIINPHTAWWHANDTDVYKKICDTLFPDATALENKDKIEKALLPFLGEPVASAKKDFYVAVQPNQTRGEEMHIKTMKAIASSPRVLLDGVLTDDDIQCNLDILIL